MQVLVESPERDDELAAHDAQVLEARVGDVPVLEGYLLAGVLVLDLRSGEDVLDQASHEDEVEVVVVEEQLLIA